MVQELFIRDSIALEIKEISIGNEEEEKIGEGCLQSFYEVNFAKGVIALYQENVPAYFRHKRADLTVKYT